VGQRAKCVLVGHVVTDEEREDPVPVEAEELHQPEHGLALVPVDAGPELEDLLTGRLSQRWMGSRHAIHDLLNRGHVLFAGLTIVNGDGELLALGPGTGEGAQLSLKLRLGLVERGEERLALLERFVPAPRARDVEAVAPGVIDGLDAHVAAHVRQVPAADDGDGAATGELLDGGAHLIGHDGLVRMSDDGRQRAVVVQKHRDLPAGYPPPYLLRLAQGRRQRVRRCVFGVPRILHQNADLVKVGHLDMGSVLCQHAGLAGPIHADDQREAPGAAGLHPRDGVLHDGGALWHNFYTSGGFQEDGGVRFAGQPEVVRVNAVDLGVEEGQDTRPLQDLDAVLAGRDDRRPQAVLSERADELDGRFVDIDAVLSQMPLKVGVLPVAEAADRFPVRRVIPVAVREGDPAGLQKADDAVVAGFAVHVVPVVGIGVERFERFTLPFGAILEVVVEQLPPGGGMDGRGLGDHPVHVENDRVQQFLTDRHRGGHR
jgi:hypothetical protein